MVESIIIVALLAVILGCAGLYVYREKKRGRKCIGCSGGCEGCGGCAKGNS